MGLFDLLRGKLKRQLLSGGDGTTIPKAIIINTTSTLIGIAEEFSYIDRHCGKRDIDYKLGIQQVVEKNGRHYDSIVIKMRNGERRAYYFDITSFYG